MLARGKSVLVLVPEIALAENYPCTLKYHSGLTPARRKLVEQQIRTGEPQLILGTRSALFLPFRRPERPKDGKPGLAGRPGLF